MRQSTVEVEKPMNRSAKMFVAALETYLGEEAKVAGLCHSTDGLGDIKSLTLVSLAKLRLSSTEIGIITKVDALAGRTQDIRKGLSVSYSAAEVKEIQKQLSKMVAGA
jgi:hypothetical protein